MATEEIFMRRAIELAHNGLGNAAPNPLVGAVLVHKGRIIGEGCHRKFGEAHAEVNCINSVKHPDRQFIPSSTLYVTLEPCSHFGKTPPCADLIINEKLKQVVIGCTDPFPKVSGTGITKLQQAGIGVKTDMLKAECRELNRRFLCFHELKRPYIILKWAETADGKISGENGARLKISNSITDRLVHRWRSEEAAIMIGTNTALLDDPLLTNRYWPGKSPVRIVVDGQLRLPMNLKVFHGEQQVIIINYQKHSMDANPAFYQVGNDASLPSQISNALFSNNIQSVIIEGGSRLLQSFIDEGYWDEARIIRNGSLRAGNGLPAPQLGLATQVDSLKILSDEVSIFRPIIANTK